MFLYICVQGVVLCPVCFLPFSASYHLSIISAFMLCSFFLACRCNILQFLTSVIFTCIIIHRLCHVVLHWYNKIFCRHVLPEVRCNFGYGTRGWFITGCHFALSCWYILWVFMELLDLSTFPVGKIILLLWLFYAINIPEVFWAPELEAG